MKNTLSTSDAIRCEFNEYTDLIDWACSYYGADAWREALGIDNDVDEEEAIKLSGMLR